MISHLKFAGIPTRDQSAALAFYTEKLGFKVVTDQPLGTQRWIELRIGGSDTRVVLFTPEGHENRVGTFFNGAFGTRQRREDLRGAVGARRRVHRPAAETAVGHLRDVQGRRRQRVRPVVAVRGQARGRCAGA